MDCNKCQQGATGEDFDTEKSWAEWGNDIAKGAKDAAVKAAAAAKVAGAAATKGTVAAAHASVAALKAAKKKYDEHYGAHRQQAPEASEPPEASQPPAESTPQATTPGQAEPKQEDDGRKTLHDHLEKCIKDAKQACNDLKATHNDTTTEEQKKELKKYENEISAIVSGLGTMFAHM